MKTVGVLVALALAGATLWYLESARAPTSMSTSAAPGAAVSQRDVEQLTAELQSLRHEVGSLKSQLAQANASRSGQAPINTLQAPEPHAAVTAEDIAATRAAEAERHREYVAGVAQSFAAEKVDPHWAGNTAALVENVLAGDPTLRTLAHRLECRERTCRLEITNADTAQLRERLPLVTLGVAGSLPTMTAEQVRQPDGRTTTVLYMSSQPTSRAVTNK